MSTPKTIAVSTVTHNVYSLTIMAYADLVTASIGAESYIFLVEYKRIREMFFVKFVF